MLDMRADSAVHETVSWSLACDGLNSLLKLESCRQYLCTSQQRRSRSLAVMCKYAVRSSQVSDQRQLCGHHSKDSFIDEARSHSGSVSYTVLCGNSDFVNGQSVANELIHLTHWHLTQVHYVMHCTMLSHSLW